MKIAVIGNFDKEITPKSRGGTEVFTYSLVSKLANNDAISQIDVFGVGKNHFLSPKVNFISVVNTSTQEFIDSHPILGPLSKTRPDIFLEVRFSMGMKIFKQLLENNYDIIHDNSTSSVFNAVADMLKSPIVTTLHTNVTSPSILVPYSLGLLKKSSRQYFVPIAEHQKKFAEKQAMDITIGQTIYNGIDIDELKFSDSTKKDSYALWIGRVSRKHNKGLKEAYDATMRLNAPLKSMVTIDDTEYYEKDIRQFLHKNVEEISREITPDEKKDMYKNAAYFLYPIIWEEPFGLVFLEAMASGTPVIAFSRGAVPEIIKDGATGFIVNPTDEDIRGNFIIKKTGIEGLCEAIQKLQSLSDEEYANMRRACCAHVLEKFTTERMAKDYADLYQQVIRGSA